MKRWSITSALLVFVFLFSACEGPVGPAGPQGERGEAGLDGRDGAANVQLVTFRLLASQFVNTGSVETNTRQMREIDEGVLSGGVVLCYTDLGTEGDTWTAMPLMLPTDALTVNMTFSLRFNFFSVELIKSQDTFNKVAEIFDFNQVRVVIIPPTASKNEDINFLDYKSVAHAYNLPA